MVDSEHFYTRRDEAARLFSQRKQWLLEHFYRHMRVQHRVLVDGAGRPVGGQWNFDQDNRKPWPGVPSEPADCRASHDHSALWQAIVAAGVNSFGEANEIIGWREYIRGFYWAHMPRYVEQNVFGHTRALPGWFWNEFALLGLLCAQRRQALDQSAPRHGLSAAGENG